MRQRRGFTDTMPEAGDKLVCLRNNRKKGLFNGGLWSVKERGGKKGTRKCFSKRALTKRMAARQMRALYLNERNTNSNSNNKKQSGG